MSDTHYVMETLQWSCDYKIMCCDCQVCPHAYTCTFLYVTQLNATSDNNICKDRTSPDADYSHLLMYSLPKVKKIETTK